jgi:hypothetical protein
LEAAPKPACSPRTPSYRLHGPTGQAVVTLSGRDYDLGRHGTPESRAEYDRLVAEWLANGRRVAGPTAEATVSEMMVGYLRHVDGYYRKDGEPTSEAYNARLSLRELRKLYGHAPARDFGPLSLKAVRQAFIAAGWHAQTGRGPRRPRITPGHARRGLRALPPESRA